MTYPFGSYPPFRQRGRDPLERLALRSHAANVGDNDLFGGILDERNAVVAQIAAVRHRADARFKGKYSCPVCEPVITRHVIGFLNSRHVQRRLSGVPRRRSKAKRINGKSCR